MKQSLINNRQHFYELLSNNSFAIIHSGYAPHKTADANYNFVVNNNFYYLTGIDQEDVILVIGKFDNQYFERLFIVPVDPYWAKWLGATLTKEEASVHPKKNVLMKALGASLEIDVDIFDCDMDITEILLSSDGLTNMLEKEQIEKVLLADGDVEDKVIKLIKKANNRGGTDNISVAYLIREEEGGKN